MIISFLKDVKFKLDESWSNINIYTSPEIGLYFADFAIDYKTAFLMSHYIVCEMWMNYIKYMNQHRIRIPDTAR